MKLPKVARFHVVHVSAIIIKTCRIGWEDSVGIIESMRERERERERKKERERETDRDERQTTMQLRRLQWCCTSAGVHWYDAGRTTIQWSFLSRQRGLTDGPPSGNQRRTDAQTERQATGLVEDQTTATTTTAAAATTGTIYQRKFIRPTLVEERNSRWRRMGFMLANYVRS